MMVKCTFDDICFGVKTHILQLRCQSIAFVDGNAHVNSWAASFLSREVNGRSLSFLPIFPFFAPFSSILFLYPRTHQISWLIFHVPHLPLAQSFSPLPTSPLLQNSFFPRAPCHLSLVTCLLPLAPCFLPLSLCRNLSPLCPLPNLLPFPLPRASCA